MDHPGPLRSREGLIGPMELRETRVDVNSRSSVVFTLEGQRYALPLVCVQRSLRVVAIVPVPGAPSIMLGIVNLGGMIVPAIDLRILFGHPPRSVLLSDHLVVASTTERVVALLVDAVEGVMEISSEDYVPAHDIVPGATSVEGVMKLPEGLVLIHDLERLLSLEEKAAVDRAVEVAEREGVSRARAGPTKGPRAKTARTKRKADGS